MTGNTSAAGRGPRSGRGDTAGFDRDFGRDGVSGLVSTDRALRARDVSRPTRAEVEAAAAVVDRLVARLDGRR